MRKTVAVFVAVLLVLTCASAAADGGGGVFIGYQMSRYPFLDRYQLPANTLGLMYFGGYGYGVSHNNWISGGFGHSLLDAGTGTGIAGGVGGFINGSRILRWPVVLSVMSWSGFGGLYTGTHPANPDRGYFCVFEEIDLELGVPLAPWFMPVLFAGYQVGANVIPGRPLRDFVSYTPVAGIRLAWGSFR